jgi:hypothetical protein
MQESAASYCFPRKSLGAKFELCRRRRKKKKKKKKRAVGHEVFGSETEDYWCSGNSSRIQQQIWVRRKHRRRRRECSQRGLKYCACNGYSKKRKEIVRESRWRWLHFLLVF